MKHADIGKAQPRRRAQRCHGTYLMRRKGCDPDTQLVECPLRVGGSSQASWTDQHLRSRDRVHQQRRGRNLSKQVPSVLVVRIP